MHLHGFVVGDRLGCRREAFDTRRQHRDRHERARSGDDHSALELVLLDADKIQGYAASRARRIQRALVGLDPADTRAPATRQDFDLFAGCERSIDEGPRDDGAETGQRERTVDPEPWPADVTTRGSGPQDRVERGDELAEAGLCCRRHFDHRRAGQRRSLERRGHVGARERCPLFIHEIAFRQRHDTAVDAEYAKDREMLPRLRHDPFVQRDHEQNRVDGTDAREHVPDEVLMPGDVDDAHLAAVGKAEPRESEIDRHAALALFTEPVRVDAGQRFDERRLAMIDMARGRDDARAHVGSRRCGAPRCTRSRPSLRGGARHPLSTAPACVFQTALHRPRSSPGSRRGPRGRRSSS